MIMSLNYDPDTIARTLSILQSGGQEGRECVVLWLARPENDRIQVAEVYRPIHEAEKDVFWITEPGMDALKARLRATRTMVAAQIHTHPGPAYHSAADDRWAIVRHEGALSLVLPNFALNSTANSFAADVKVYRLNQDDRWMDVTLTAQEYLCLR
jgi:hypothetical protein